MGMFLFCLHYNMLSKKKPTPKNALIVRKVTLETTSDSSWASLFWQLSPSGSEPQRLCITQQTAGSGLQSIHEGMKMKSKWNVKWKNENVNVAGLKKRTPSSQRCWLMYRVIESMLPFLAVCMDIRRSIFTSGCSSVSVLHMFFQHSHRFFPCSLIFFHLKTMITFFYKIFPTCEWIGGLVACDGLMSYSGCILISHYLFLG